MILIVGLGNPGEKYENTRHNVGFIAVEATADKLSPDGFSFFKKFQSQIILTEKKIILAKPQTFMNLSGKAVAGLANYYKIRPEDILVIHDDIDLELGRLKIQSGGASAGHHGLESIIEYLKSEEFIRFRIGIGRREMDQGDSDNDKNSTIDYVLKKFSSKEQEIVNDVIGKITKAIEFFLQNGLGKTMNKFN